MPGSRDARHATGVPARAAACRNIPAQSLLQTEAGRGRSRRPRLAASKRPGEIAADGQERACRRPGGEPSLGHCARGTDRTLHAVLSDVLFDRVAAALARYERELAVDPGMLETRVARVGPGDRIFFPFSFGPFLGFWSAFDAGCQIGAQCVPGGGMSSQIRLRMIETIGATVVCCTPTYALRLADLAAEENGVGKDAPPLS